MYTIYCDMDGVLVDFEKGYKELTNTTPSRSFDGKASFWEPISKAGAQWWVDLDWMPDGQELWRYIKKYKPNISEKDHLIFDNLIGYAIKYFNDVIKIQKKYKKWF